MTDLLAHVEGIWQAVVPMLPDFTIEVLPVIDSTNSELMRRGRNTSLAPVLLVAQEQTAGRGRMGKRWHSQTDHSLTFSMALPLSPDNWSGLSLAVGVSLAESLHPELQLKWPNDLWWQQRKLGGILVETVGTGAGLTTARTVVVGVGINITRPSDGVLTDSHLSPPHAPPAAGLTELHRDITPGSALALLAPALVRDMLRFEAHGFAAFVQSFAQRDALHGLPLQLSDNTTGTGAGVDDLGRLLLQTPQGLRPVTSSEVSVRLC